MTDAHTAHKAFIAPLHAAMYDFTPTAVQRVLADVVSPDAVVHMPHPWGDMMGGQALYDTCYAPLLAAWPEGSEAQFNRHYISIQTCP